MSGDNFYEQIYAVLSVSYGDNDFNNIVNDSIAPEINNVITDELCLDKASKINNIIAKAYGNTISTQFATDSILFAAKRTQKI